MKIINVSYFFSTSLILKNKRLRTGRGMLLNKKTHIVVLIDAWNCIEYTIIIDYNPLR